ncbi:MAG: Protein of unknown function (DUF1553)/Protein of unknown function (DUF1549)/Planctomycete [Planctomycetaceae bacterium]|nr:Protein of unknown function (DUF1553)/Protein of unknown function (DUF1549)/Planctomycete [Planctomycetaceae bacterium]
MFDVKHPAVCPLKDRCRSRRAAISRLAMVIFSLSCAAVSDTTSKLLADDGHQEKAQALLRLKCVKCHGPLKPKGDLNLSSFRGVARGGKKGAVVVSGKANESPLWERVEAGEMPPDAPLPADEKALLRQWIEAGARGLPAGDLGPAVGGDHWAFQALSSAPAPAVRDASRVRTDIDRHVQARLETQGLAMSPDADPRVLLRRVCLDLTGLPPTPEDVEQFSTDSSEASYQRMIDKYLASPRYGERWGKHWLDAAGYADSNGYFSADTDRPLAYRYRDYVIRSLNTDKPFDRFVREQLAGDEMTKFRPGQPTAVETIELLEATHFLRNGQDGSDIGVQEPEAFEVDRRAALEAAVQVTASSLLGLTVHCARCHDHKFEPITQAEYYQLQAILFPAFNPQDWTNPKDRTIYAYLPGEKESWEQNEQRVKSELALLRKDYTEWLTKNREPSELLFQESFADDGWKSRWSNTAPGDDHPGGAVNVGGPAANGANVVDGTLQIISGPAEAWLSTINAFDWTPETQGAWMQVSFDLLDNKVGGNPAERIGYTLAAHDFDDSGTRNGGNLLIDGNPTTATNIYADYPGTDQKVLGAIGEQGYVPGRNYGVRVTNIGNDKFRLEHLIDGLVDGKSFEVTAADLPDGGFAFFYCAGRSYIVDEVRVERSLAETKGQLDIAALRQQIEVKRKAYEEQRGKLQSQRSAEPGRAIAWVSDKSAKAPEVPLLTRGLYHLRGPGVQPSALQVLTDPGNEYQPLPPGGDFPMTGRRLGFAEWLTKPGGRPAALMARVHANRIWRQYFGRGIAATTDNLGLGGSSPTNPELLEHLANFLVSHGWSQKALHRHIVTSTAYRQSSAPRPEGLAADPDNRYLWRWPMRRLEAEVIRDGMLAVSGQLDTTSFGPYVPTRQTIVGEVVVNEDVPGARRRSIYLQQRRSQTLSMLKVFDAPAIATVCTTRPSSTVPLQSLALLNSDFAILRGEAFAGRLLKETDGSPAELVRRAWRVAIGRDPLPAEQTLALEFLEGQRTQYTGPDAAIRALADFCQMLLASNSFLYLE